GVGRVSPDRFVRPNTTVLMLVTYAYAVDGVQVEGGDPWMRESRFHVDAKAEGRPTDEQMRGMVRQLLAERFHLKTHVETRDLPRYAMVQARGDGRLGERLRPSHVDCRSISSMSSDELRAARSADRWLCTR